MRTIKVGDVFEPGNSYSLIISEETSLEEIISTLAEDPTIRGVFLVDSRQRFAGVITRADLLKWASLRFGRRAGQSSRIRISRRDIADLVISTQAKDVAEGDWRNLGVRPDDDLETAIHQMFEHEAIDIPVLDADGKIIGDLRVSQVLRKAIEVSRNESTED